MDVRFLAETVASSAQNLYDPTSPVPPVAVADAIAAAAAAVGVQPVPGGPLFSTSSSSSAAAAAAVCGSSVVNSIDLLVVARTVLGVTVAPPNDRAQPLFVRSPAPHAPLSGPGDGDDHMEDQDLELTDSCCGCGVTAADVDADCHSCAHPACRFATCNKCSISDGGIRLCVTCGSLKNLPVTRWFCSICGGDESPDSNSLRVSECCFRHPVSERPAG